jgi:hypothetical protein
MQLVVQAVDLAALAKQINAAHEAGEAATRKGLEYYRAAGADLLKAKDQLKHGEWLGWLKANVQCSHQRASEYMRLAEGWDKLPPGGNLGLKEALAFLDGGARQKRAGGQGGQSRRKGAEEGPSPPEEDAGPTPKQVTFNMEEDQYKEYQRLDTRLAKAFGTEDNDTATLLRAYQFCAKGVANG